MAHLELHVAADPVEGDRPQPVRQLRRPADREVDPDRLAVGLQHRLEALLLQRVDRLRGAGVQAEVAGPREHRDGRVAVVGEGRERAAGLGEGVRRVELALEPELLAAVLLGRVGDLDDAEGPEAAVLRKEDHRSGEGRGAVRVAHRDVRRVAVADQEDVGALDAERVVDRDRLVALRGARRGPVGEVGGELVRHPLLATLTDEGHVEVVHGEVERLELGGVEQRAGTEVVVLAQRVGEAVLGDDDDAALEAEQPTDREADQDDQHREVEEQVAGLAQVAALGRDGRVLGDHAVAALPQAGVRALEHRLGFLVGHEVVVRREPAEVAGCLRRLTSYAAPVDEQPRHDAADQREHQQDVDRREPHRVVDREQPQLLVDRRQLGVGLAPLGGTQRVDRLLRDHRPRDRAERQQEQQDQRRAHRGELAPRPAGGSRGRNGGGS